MFLAVLQFCGAAVAIVISIAIIAAVISGMINSIREDKRK